MEGGSHAQALHDVQAENDARGNLLRHVPRLPGEADDGGALDPPSCRRVVEALDLAVDQLADLP